MNADAPIPRDPAAAREELRRLLRAEGFLQAGPGQPIRSITGWNAQWMFYSWQATLTQRGLALAARCILDHLAPFDATQIASYGYTALPILSACVVLGGGRYTGLCVREVRKAHGSMRRIDGPVARDGPVVLIDDSLVSGTSMVRAIGALQAEGLDVGGVIALVNFPAGGGEARLRSLGVPVTIVFDLYRDLEATPPPPLFGYRRLVPEPWDAPPLDAGMSPATAARQVAERYLAGGEVPRPPPRLDADYDGRGGVFVSIRERESNRRLTREGFWHFVPTDADPCRDLVLATVMALRRGPPIEPGQLPGLKFAVSWLGPLERVPPGKLDFSRYGVVVRSRLGHRAGGALPNTQYFLGELEQYRHARWVNAGLRKEEPHELYRHGLTKCIEPGEYWPPFGAEEGHGFAWTHDAAIGRCLTARARELLHAAARGTEPAGDPLPDGLIPAPVYTVAVTLYRRGVVGCAFAWDGSLDACLREAVRGAYEDARSGPERRRLAVSEIAVAVSILHDQEWLGPRSIQEVAARVRHGLDSLSVETEATGAMFLPAVAVYRDWSKERLARELLRKAGDPPAPWDWAIYPTATWIEHAGRRRRLRFGFPDRGHEPYGSDRWRGDIALIAGFIERLLGKDGLPAYEYLPVTGEQIDGGFVGRRIHALWALDEAGRILENADWREAARRGISHCLRHVRASGDGKARLELPDQPANPTADAVLLLAVASSAPSQLDGVVADVARGLRSLIRADGRIVERVEAPGLDQDHEFMPGLVLAALARLAVVTGDRDWVSGLTPVARWYRRRFHLCHPWGMVGWHGQAWADVYAVTRARDHADIVFEIADWALPWQNERSGNFSCDLEPTGKSFHTAFLTEGIAAAWRVAASSGDGERTARYRTACHEALRFMNRLIIRGEEGFCFREPHRATGGVRGNLFTSAVRIDHASHTLLAIASALGMEERKAP